MPGCAGAEQVAGLAGGLVLAGHAGDGAGAAGSPAFSYGNPNKIYALVGGFAGNALRFHAADGSGYAFMVDQILRLDPQNPQVASRLLKAFGRWRRFDADRQALMRDAMERIAATPACRPTAARSSACRWQAEGRAGADRPDIGPPCPAGRGSLQGRGAVEPHAGGGHCPPAWARPATGPGAADGRPDRGRLPAEYAAAAAILARLEIPLLLQPGNHDEREAFRATFAAAHPYLPPAGLLHYAIGDRGPVRVVALDVTLPGLHHGMSTTRPRTGWPTRWRPIPAGRRS